MKLLHGIFEKPISHDDYTAGKFTYAWQLFALPGGGLLIRDLSVEYKISTLREYERAVRQPWGKPLDTGGGCRPLYLEPGFYEFKGSVYGWPTWPSHKARIEAWYEEGYRTQPRQTRWWEK